MIRYGEDDVAEQTPRVLISTDAKAEIGTKIQAVSPTTLVSKRGRPATLADQPWKSEGISRRTWFRRASANRSKTES